MDIVELRTIPSNFDTYMELVVSDSLHCFAVVQQVSTHIHSYPSILAYWKISKIFVSRRWRISPRSSAFTLARSTISS